MTAKIKRAVSLLLAAAALVAVACLFSSCLRDPLKGKNGIDVDLTQLSSGLVYSTVSDIMQNPDDYVGKKFRMRGLFTMFSTEKRNYYSCIVQDATACCANGIEFTTAEEFTYPDDYPEIGDEITVIGIFDKYDDEGFTCYHLRDAEMKIGKDY